MMNGLLLRITPLLLYFPLMLYAQESPLSVYHEMDEKTRALTIYGKNEAIMPYSVKVEAQVSGMQSTPKLPIIMAIPPQSTVVLGVFTPKPNTSFKFGYNTTIIQGDINAKHDNKHVYLLPYKEGMEYRIDQGYNGKHTHQGKSALDFHMDEGTEICAIRDGLVVQTEDNNKKGCPDQSCGKFNNYIKILHDDGSIADYSHLKKNGVLVRNGDRVKAGQVIGLSGSTGVASGPHLHLEVDMMGWEGQISVAVKYDLDGKPGIPQEGQSYKR